MPRWAYACCAAASASGPAVRRFRAPPPRLVAGALLARAAPGVGDDRRQRRAAAGSRAPLRRQRASGARIELARVPCSPARCAAPASLLALTGGEDYELLCSPFPAAPSSARRASRRPVRLSADAASASATRSARACGSSTSRRADAGARHSEHGFGGHDPELRARAAIARMTPDRLRRILEQVARGELDARRRLRAGQASAVRGSRLRQGRPSPRAAQRRCPRWCSAPARRRSRSSPSPARCATAARAS